MALSLTKSYTPSSGEVANSASYNTDIAALFNAFTGIEAQTSTLGALAILPTANGVSVLQVKNAAGVELLSADTTNSAFSIKATAKLNFDGQGGTSYISEVSDGNLGISGVAVGVTAAKRIYLDGIACTGNTYIVEQSADNFYLVVGGTNTIASTNALITLNTTAHVNGGVAIKINDNDHLIYNASTGAGTATLYIGNASINVTSDIRIKKDIEDTKINATELINKMRVVDFAWNDPSDTAPVNRNTRGRYVGMIAQETIDIAPWIVNAPDRECPICRAGQPCEEHKQTWKVEYEHLVPTLVKAVQELSAKIKALEVK